MSSSNNGYPPPQQEPQGHVVPVVDEDWRPADTMGYFDDDQQQGGAAPMPPQQAPPQYSNNETASADAYHYDDAQQQPYYEDSQQQQHYDDGNNYPPADTGNNYDYNNNYSNDPHQDGYNYNGGAGGVAAEDANSYSTPPPVVDSANYEYNQYADGSSYDYSHRDNTAVQDDDMQQYPHNPYMDGTVDPTLVVHQDTTTSAAAGTPTDPVNVDDHHMVHDDNVADRDVFNTSAIHGQDQYDTGNPNHHNVKRENSVVAWMRRKPRWAAACAAFAVVLLIGILIGVSGSKSSNGSVGNTPNGANTLGEPVVGTTKDGPKKPVQELPVDVVKSNKQEFGAVLVGLYKKYQLTTWTDIGDPTTVSGLALDWITGTESQYNAFNTAQRIQRFALAAFYYATFMRAHAFWTDPTDWTSAQNWMTTQHECTWEGVVCDDETNQVIAILLPAHALSGYLPTELAFLEQLQQLDLNNNYIHMSGAMAAADAGEDPATDPATARGLQVFGLLPNMMRLEMDDNYIMTETGLPTELQQMTSLRRLSLSYNLLQGPIKGEIIGSWPQLTHLEIESNYLTGTLPAEMGQLENLYYMYLRRNLLDIDLDQVLSPSAGTGLQAASTTTPYASIFSLWLDDNNVVGTLPSTIGTLTGLASFSITNTTLQGEIPTEIGLCLELQRLWLYGNDLTGTIPTELASLSQLQVLELYENELTGSMPNAVCDIVQASDYEFKTLSADCHLVECDDCCTACYYHK